eukprot:gnl/TRDRNA2_/TRDRNA2_187615_c0_seq1.p1 gnl/TRDRNA2_/TRDRNA2_187615_c0~~gnl/TRDRNA2_/TRDRNA2_187615_c0_seq1.p1  ORF type:complete len:490 (-),score=64.52 gnl/TRDRNA2_/TRDRNA2_187615_c0_seq1:94-1422(-)
MFDVGSSGTSLFVYENTAGVWKLIKSGWEDLNDGQNFDDTPLRPTLKEEPEEGRAVETQALTLRRMMKNGPRLTDFYEHPESAAGAYYAQLTLVEKLFLTKPPHSTGPAGTYCQVFLECTAGVRLMDPTKTREVLASMERDLKSRGSTVFNFQYAKVASGEKEALYESITVNYLSHNAAGFRTIAEKEPKEYYGMLELGGASLQIAFRPSEAIRDHELIYYPGGHGTTPLSLYAVSYMRFGQDEGLQRLREHLYQHALAREQKGGTIANPCMTRGTEKTYKVQLPGGGNASEPQEMKFHGTGNPSDCDAEVQKLMGADVECMMPPCAIFGTHQPNFPENFKAYAVSSFYFIAKDFKLDHTAQILPIHFKMKATEACTMEESDLKQAYGSYSDTLCFTGHFVYHVLKSLKFRDDDTRISFSGKINNQTISWTLGGVLYNTELA